MALRAMRLSTAHRMGRRANRAPSISAMKLLVLACARPRQSLWQLPSSAARYMCAAVVYTRFEKLFRSLDIHEL